MDNQDGVGNSLRKTQLYAPTKSHEANGKVILEISIGTIKNGICKQVKMQYLQMFVEQVQ